MSWSAGATPWLWTSAAELGVAFLTISLLAQVISPLHLMEREGGRRPEGRGFGRGKDKNHRIQKISGFGKISRCLTLKSPTSKPPSPLGCSKSPGEGGLTFFPFPDNTTIFPYPSGRFKDTGKGHAGMSRGIFVDKFIISKSWSPKKNPLFRVFIFTGRREVFLANQNP